MNDQKKRNQRLILLVMVMSFIPFIFAWILTKNPQWLSPKTTNVGDLIIPPVATERNELTGYDQFSVDNLFELDGHWVMVNIIPGKTCNELCREALHKTKQLRLMMDKDLTRIRRVVIVSGPVDPEQAEQWWKDDTRLLRAIPSAEFLAKLKQIRKGGIPDGMMLLMDPFGNLMMQYEPGFDPYDAKKDMKKLLRISQIG